MSNSINDKLKKFFRYVVYIYIAIIFIMALLNYLPNYGIWRDITFGFITSSIFSAIVYLFNRPEVLCGYLKDLFQKDRNEHWIEYTITILSIPLQIILLLGFVFVAYYMVDYDFVNEVISYFGYADMFPPPKTMVKLSFLINGTISYYCISRAFDE